ncbi:MAG: hypothetical protein L6Q71_02215 [Planctomycetes bacterium]|nr:hypothetical protein [Planctomycetota bacterium]
MKRSQYEITEEPWKADARKRVRDAIADGKGKEFGLTLESIDRMQGVIETPDPRFSLVEILEEDDVTLRFAVRVPGGVHICTPMADEPAPIQVVSRQEFAMKRDEQIIALLGTTFSFIVDHDHLADQYFRWTVIMGYLDLEDGMTEHDIEVAVNNVPWLELVVHPLSQVLPKESAQAILSEMLPNVAVIAKAMWIERTIHARLRKVVVNRLRKRSRTGVLAK